MRTRSLIPSALLALFVSASAWSQSEPAVPASEDPAAPVQSDFVIKDDSANAASSVTKATGSAGGDTLSVDFPDEDIRNILRNVADLFEINLVVPDTLQGRTSIKLRDVSWRQIFQVVLSPVGFTYIEEGNIIKIVSNESLAAEPLSTEVFIINYAPAGELKPALDPLANSPGGGIRVDTRSNALIITERPTQINKIRPIIEQLDKATAQVMIETKFVEVTQGNVKDLGLDWTLNASAGIGQDYAKSRTNAYDKSRGNSRSQDTVNTSLNNPTSRLDAASGRVLFSDSSTTGGSTITTQPPGGATTTTHSPTITDNAFGDSSLNSTTTANAGLISSSVMELSENAGNFVNLFNNVATSGLNTAVFSNYEFGVVLRALQTLNDTKLISNPTVVTLNNSEASINIGSEFPIPNYTYNQERGTYEVSGFEYKPLGIILKVTPQVNAQGFIKLTVEPEVSSSSESASFGGAQIPIVSTRKTKTQVSLKDGYTMGIGGLIETRTTNTQNKLPVLGSLPGIGRLFRSDSVTENMRNLIIFITAKTVSPDGAPIEEIFDSRRVQQLKMRRDELPGYRDGSDPFLSPGEVKVQRKR